MKFSIIEQKSQQSLQKTVELSVSLNIQTTHLPRTQRSPHIQSPLQPFSVFNKLHLNCFNRKGWSEWIIQNQGLIFTPKTIWSAI